MKQIKNQHKESKHPHAVKDYFLSQEEFYLEAHQEFSGLLKTRPVPNNLSKYYQSNNYLSHNPNRKSLFSWLYHHIKSINTQIKYQQIRQYKNTGNALDFGCGVGDFLYFLQKRKWRVFGIEPEEKALQKAKEKLPKDAFAYKKLQEIPSNSMDLISLWHVLEHIPNLEDTKTELLRILKPNGLLVIALPNYDSYDARFYGKFWAAWDVPRHLWHFNTKAMHSFFKESGWEIVKRSPLWFDAFYVSWLSAKYTNSLVQLFLFPLVALWSNFVSIFTKNPSSMVYFLQKAP